MKAGGGAAVSEAVGSGMNGLPGTKSRAAAQRRNVLWSGAPGAKLAAAADMGCARAAATLPSSGSRVSGGVSADASLP